MPVNVLIVDDSKAMRMVIEKTLHMTHIDLGKVYHAEHGKQAIEVLENHWVDVAFVDINMPVMDGIQLIQHMSEHGVTQSIPVVVVSTEGSQTRIDQLRSNGVRAYLRKPVQAEALSQTLMDVLETPHAA